MPCGTYRQILSDTLLSVISAFFSESFKCCDCYHAYCTAMSCTIKAPNTILMFAINTAVRRAFRTLQFA